MGEWARGRVGEWRKGRKGEWASAVFTVSPIRRFAHSSFHVNQHRPPADTTEMDENHLWVSLVFGAIGAGMFLYGKKAGRMVPLGVGVGLMILPYFISNVLLLLLVCGGLTAVPLVVKDG